MHARIHSHSHSHSHSQATMEFLPVGSGLVWQHFGSTLICLFGSTLICLAYTVGTVFGVRASHVGKHIHAVMFLCSCPHAGPAAADDT